MKSRRGLIFSGVSLILCAVLWTAAVGAQAGIYARSTKVLPHTGYSAEGLPLTIPDVSTVESPLEVSEAVTVEDVNVLINLTHTFDNDLQIARVSPSGTEVILANHFGSSGNNFTNTVFDDEATSPIGSGVAPFTGAFQPSQPLAGLDGTTGQGTWKLVVRDQVGGDSGVLLNWRLILNAQSDLLDSYHYVPNTPADWLVTDGRLRAGIGVGHPAHNSASINLADFNWSLNPAKRQNWSLDVAKRNEWGGWMDLNRRLFPGGSRGVTVAPMCWPATRPISRIRRLAGMRLGSRPGVRRRWCFSGSTRGSTPALCNCPPARPKSFNRATIIWTPTTGSIFTFS